jgi:sugar porter (SP) family MFS transporter
MTDVAEVRDDPEPHDEATAPRMTRWLMMVAVVIMLAGLLFGYDQGVISGALVGIDKDFSVSTLATEIITSWVTLGALVGALVAGILADRIGRRKAVLWAAFLFIVGALIEALAPDVPVLVVGRLVVGFGVGVASVAAPLYAAEMAPARLRGRFVSMYQLAITIGIFIAYLVDEFLSSGDWWRLMLGLSVVPGVLLFIAMWPMPDSTVWYEKEGRRADAEDALRKVRPDENVGEALATIDANLAEEQASWKEVFSERWRAPLVIGVGLALFQQLTGINAVIYYADKIFAAAGFSSTGSQTAATTWAIGGVNVLLTFVAVAWVDKLGRRPLLLAGLVGMGVALTTIAICFADLNHVTIDSTSATNSPNDAGVIMLVATMVFIGSFAFSLGPVVWTVINEISPSKVRGRGVAIATAANWGAAWLVTQFFLSLTDLLGESGTFGLFAFMCVVAFVFVWRLLPETKGRTLDGIQDMWEARHAKSRG